jgi:hypothetical protein
MTVSRRDNLAPLDDFEDTLPSSGPARPSRAETVGAYELIALIGEGGMGAVHKAFDPKLNRFVALKLLHRDQPMSLLRFRREARIIAQIHHPHIADIYEFSENPPFIAMRLIDGVHIDRAAGDRIAALRDAARAVHRANLLGVIHRDLKPANILVDKTGHAYVLDFGIAKQLDEQHDLTKSGRIAGTPAYMSPEQAQGKNTIDARTDVYGLGATLYQLLAGAPPHQGSNEYELIKKIVEDEPIFPDAQPELMLIARRAMEKDPDQRYPSAEAFADDLDRYLTHRPIEARPPSRFYRARKILRRHPLIAALLFLLLATVTSSVYFARAKAEQEWVTVIGENFTDPAARALEWKTLRGEVTIHDGALCSRNGHAVFDVELQDHVQIEYRATAPLDSTDPRELSAFVSGSDEAGLANGYCAEFFLGDDKNKYFYAITRRRKMMESVPAAELERGRVYRLALVRSGASLSTELDGERVVSVEDSAPLSGSEHTRFGIGSKGDHVHFDDFVVRLPLRDARTFAARAVAEKNWRRAEPALASIAELERDPAQLSRLTLLRVEALLRLGRREEADVLSAAIEGDVLDPETRFAATALKAELLAEKKNFHEAFELLRREHDGEGGRFPTAGDRLRAAGRRVIRAISEAERETVLRAELVREPAPFTADVVYAWLEQTGSKLEELPEQVRPFAAGYLGFEESQKYAEAAGAIADRFYTRAWLAEYWATAGLWAIDAGKLGAAREAFAKADASTYLRTPMPFEIATFGIALLGDEAGVRSRIQAADNDYPEQRMWHARALILLGDHAGARENYRAIIARWSGRLELYPLWEARLLLGEISEAQFGAAASSNNFDFPFAYASGRAVIFGLAHEIAGRSELSREEYRKLEEQKTRDIALRLLAKKKLSLQ